MNFKKPLILAGDRNKQGRGSAITVVIKTNLYTIFFQLITKYLFIACTNGKTINFAVKKKSIWYKEVWQFDFTISKDQ